MADLLIEMKTAAELARAAARKRLSHKALASYLARYDTILEMGLVANPEPEGPKRDYLAKESYNLACALRDLKSEVTLLPRTSPFPFRTTRLSPTFAWPSSSRRSPGRSGQSRALSAWLGSAPTSRLLASTASTLWTS